MVWSLHSHPILCIPATSLEHCHKLAVTRELCSGLNDELNPFQRIQLNLVHLYCPQISTGHYFANTDAVNELNMTKYRSFSNLFSIRVMFFILLQFCIYKMGKPEKLAASLFLFS